jgi:hypothetical protein
LLHGAQGVEAVLAAQVITHFHATAGQCTQNSHSVGNALVARYGDGTVQALCSSADCYGIT